MERQVFGKRFLLAFLIASVIFSMGFITSYLVTTYQYRAISANQERLRYNLLELDLQRRLIDCETFDPYILAREMDYSGSITEAIEQRFGRDNEKVIEQKKIYSLIQMQHFLIVQEHNEVCNNSLDTVLFFYSNEKESVDGADKTGIILSHLKKTREVMVYSFDFDIDSSVLKLIKSKYDIQKPNTIMINEEIKLENIQNVREVEAYL